MEANAEVVSLVGEARNVALRLEQLAEPGQVICTADTERLFKGRFQCTGLGQHKIKGVQVNYKSADKYVGDDALDLLVLFPGGFAWELHYNVSVR